MKKKNMMKIIIFIVVLLIPVIYSFFYLKSYWNPYGDLTGIKIAVVNLDEGKEGENQGKEFVQGLKDSATFAICESSLNDANEGMQNGEYYATILIPSNFTECLNSASTTDKQIATITYSPNQASNYLATQIINSAIKTMETNLQGKIDRKIVETLADKLEEVPDSLQEISDGAGEILDGSESLSSGMKQINDGTTTLNNSYTEFDNGVSSAYEGSKAIDSGITQVNSGVDSLNEGSKKLDTAISKINDGVDALNTQGSSGIEKLTEGFASLAEGAQQVSDGVSSIGTSLNKQLTASQSALLKQAGVSSDDQLDTAITTYTSQLKQLITVIGTYGNSETYQKQCEDIIDGLANLNQAKGAYTALEGVKTSITESSTSTKGDLYRLAAGAQQVSDGAAELNSTETISSLTALTEGIQSLQEALVAVKQGTTDLNNGVSTLSTGTNELATGSTTLTNGLSKLNNSSTEIKSALNALNDGTNSAYEGSTQLVSGVTTFQNEINKGMDETNEALESLEGIGEFAEDPVEFKTEAYGEVNSYGIAFTPLFLCIGLWVGSLMCYVVLYYDQKNRFGILGSDAKNKLLQNAIYIVIGAIEGIITGALLKAGLGYEIQNIGLYYTASILIGITFMSIIQFLIRNFGDIGKFLALIILVLQLAAAGGTFPVETIDKGFQSIHAYLPMTYSIKLLKEILVPTATNFRGKYIGILIGITIVTLAITYGVDMIKNKKKEEK